jgi:hypothetical protein
MLGRVGRPDRYPQDREQVNNARGFCQLSTKHHTSRLFAASLIIAQAS